MKKAAQDAEIIGESHIGHPDGSPVLPNASDALHMQDDVVRAVRHQPYGGFMVLHAVVKGRKITGVLIPC